MQSGQEISSLGATNCVLEGDAGTYPLSPADRPPRGRGQDCSESLRERLLETRTQGRAPVAQF